MFTYTKGNSILLVGFSTCFVQITVETQDERRLGNTRVCLQWANCTTDSAVSFIWQIYSIGSSHSSMSTYSRYQQQTYTQGGFADGHQRLQINSSGVWSVMLLVLSIQVLTATELKPCSGAALRSHHLVHPPPRRPSGCFSSGRPHLCHWAARWHRQGSSGPSASENVR